MNEMSPYDPTRYNNGYVKSKRDLLSDSKRAANRVLANTKSSEARELASCTLMLIELLQRELLPSEVRS